MFIRRHVATGRHSSRSILEQLQGFAAMAADWESEILPRRIKDYRSGWLDEVLGRATWLWRAGNGTRDEPRVAFFPRDFLGELGHEPESSAPLSPQEETVMELLQRHGASFATDLARLGGMEPSRLHRDLRELLGRGLVTNDRFDPLRSGSESTLQALAEAAATSRAGPLAPNPAETGARAAGRGAMVAAGSAAVDPESGLLAWAAVLLGAIWCA